MTFDVIVLGLGAMGSAAAYHLAQRGTHVLGIEQFTTPHDKGSSHGGSRMIRQAYFESPDYIPLVLRAYELWRKLEADSGMRLLNITGGLILGAADGELVQRSTAAARQHQIPFDVLDRAQANRRFPAVELHPAEVAVLEPHAGYLLPEECIRAHLGVATGAGAELHFEEKALSWTVQDGRVKVRTDRATYEGGRLIITAGPWANDVLNQLFPLRVTRQVMAWIQPRGGVEPFVPEKFPVFLSDLGDGRPAYGFPAIDGPAGGVKTAIHGSEAICTPDTVDRTIHDSDLLELKEKVRRRMPSLDGEVLQAQTCLYTMTPDEHFVIGAHPRNAACTVACGFSGHGFKFAPVVGEILADLSTAGVTSHPIRLFSPTRFIRP